ncbi:hypothetical protein CNMCM8980_009830 [Aspergillus fumigatiaffinis]|uniref:Gag1-like clamp domain-containing protein n=1 Tax=Aspergillus fumigatiaffinis TaxID=340414 RepID=A0A8H4M0A9_9EURO|nr:hypothetical protein CNMCM6457_009450 [Aspergillus fumigatiaffinis]KAF4234411.1 hypothetical protein CNMCM6805_008643 [Aspergillus fumigatiaffinis]KAF4245178.1 hypothetical protein CNMCM8980_009830 [Aspergillus fumigatiaffinis]
MSAEARDAAIREAKRHVFEVVRNDWAFEPSSAASGAPASATPAAPEQQWLEWRLREYDSSGSELEPQDEPDSPGGLDGDSSGSSRVVTARERRRKRRRQLEEDEMRWNMGLRTWVERRDAWTGARSKDEVLATEDRERGPAVHTPGETQAMGAERDGTADLVARTGSSLAIAEKEGELQQAQADQAVDEPAKESTETGLAVPGSESSHDESVSPPPPPSAGEVRDPLIPVAPSFIPVSNPVRASITPAMYPSIYSKVVVQALTPTVPINLADVVKAMVQGWKSDGQWPPKPTSIVLPDDSIVHKNGSATGDAQGSHESKRRSSVVGAVKKVFHFSGFHSNPFHRRGSSHGSHPEAHDGQPKDGGSDPPGAGHPSK